MTGIIEIYLEMRGYELDDIITTSNIQIKAHKGDLQVIITISNTPNICFSVWSNKLCDDYKTLIIDDVFGILDSLLIEKKDVETFIKEHNHINYCKCFIDRRGRVGYAVPSHLYALMSESGLSRGEISVLMAKDATTPIDWIIDYTGYICVYTNCYKVPKDNKITNMQRESLNKLIEAGLTKGDKLKFYKVCEVCERSNHRTRFSKYFAKTLCDSCLLMFKKYPFVRIPMAGQLEYDEDGNILCHVCGRGFKKLSEHIQNKHNMTNEEYKEIFGLNRTAKLTGKNFISPANLREIDITKYSINTRIKKGEKIAEGKTKRLQTINNRTGLKYKVKSKED